MAETLEKQITYILSTFHNVELAILFGSAANERLSKTSDLDIAISSRIPLTAEVKWEIIQELANKLGRPVDLIDLKNASPLLTAEIIKNGKRLLGANTCYSEFLSRHIMDYEDFAPLQKRILKERRERWIKQ